MLGDIVHNEEVSRRMKETGIKKISTLTLGRGRTLLLRAHGTSAATVSKAAKLGYRIVDATCPMVKQIHKIAVQMHQKGYSIIVIGEKRHDEVHGIIGQLRRGAAIAISTPDDAALKRIDKNKKYAVVVQSTQNKQKVMEILRALRKRARVIKFFNTICRPTTIKQEEIRRMPLKNDLMLIIGSRTSANTRRLYEISKSINSKSYWVDGANQIKRSWFRGVKSVGVTAGASTPDSAIMEVVARARAIL